MLSSVKRRPGGPRPWRSYGRPLIAVMLLMSLALVASRWQFIPMTSDYSQAAADCTKQGQQEKQQRVLISEQTASGVGAAAVAMRSSWALSDYDNWQPPQYSSHYCITQKFDDYWQMSTCKFDNVCLNASTLEIEYYMDPAYGRNPVAYNQEGKAYVQFSPHLLNPTHGLVEPRKPWRPVVKRVKFPEGPRVKWAPTEQAMLQAVPVKFLYNFGHVMFDVLVPFFNMQHLFGVYTPDALPLVLEPVASKNGDDEFAKALPRYVNTATPDKSLLHLTWDHDMVLTKDYVQRVLGDAEDGLVCFKTALAGTAFLNRRMMHVDALPYRQAVVEKIGLQEARQQVPTITILNKKGRRIIENSDEIHSILKQRFPAAQVTTIDFAKWPNMTMADQVKLMSDTSILISPCGGLATVLTFLRPSSTAIVMNYWHTLKNRSMHMEDNYYRNLEYLDIQYFPVTLDDYTGTRDRPGCELVENGTSRYDDRFQKSGALVNCNLLLRGQAMARMLHHVDAAMMRWASRMGRYEVVASIRNETAQEEGQQGQ